MKTLLLTLSLVSALRAQTFEVSVSGGQGLLQNSGLGKISAASLKDDFKLANGFRLGFRTTLNTGKFIGHEFGYIYQRSGLVDVNGGTTTGMAIHNGLYDFLVYGIPEGKKIRPFVAGGGQFSNFVPPGSSAAQGGGSTKVGVNYGGGIKVIVSSMFLIRADIRQYLSTKPFDLIDKRGAVRQTEISIGFGFHL